MKLCGHCRPRLPLVFLICQLQQGRSALVHYCCFQMPGGVSMLAKSHLQRKHCPTRVGVCEHPAVHQRAVCDLVSGSKKETSEGGIYD